MSADVRRRAPGFSRIFHARAVQVVINIGRDLHRRGFDVFPMTHHVECVAVLLRESRA